MSGFGFTPNEGIFGAPINEGMPMLASAPLRDGARKFLATHNDLPVGVTDLNKIIQACEIANTWIEGSTQFPQSASNSDVAWTRREWMESSIPGWQKLVEPLAQGMAEALVKVMGEVSPEIPEEMRANFNVESFLPMMRGFMGSMIAGQLGQSIGALAISVTGSNDVALPLFAKNGVHLLPQNVAAWGEGLEIPEQEVLIYLALREVAAHRLFTHTPWLADYLRDLITAYGKGITVDIQSIQSQAEDALNSGELDINNPDSITLAINNGMFQPEQSPAQSAALAKLEMALALIEGWIDHVVTLSAHDRLPSLAALQENHRRARIESAPSQQLFASLLGLEVSPRKMRECAHFWNAIYEITLNADGNEEAIRVRDHRWEDPTLLPTATDLSDPAGFLASTTVPDDLSGLI
jgi:putative hydrolase